MGCSHAPKSLDLDDLIRQQSSFYYQVDENNKKIENYEIELQGILNKIKQGENDIKLKQFQYSKEELVSKAKKLIGFKRDGIRIQNSINYLTTMNETLKNNSANLERKINEYKSVKELKQGNDIMAQINKENHNKIIEENINNLLVQKKKDEQNQKMLERGNDLYIGDGFNADNYLKQLLGTPN